MANEVVYTYASQVTLEASGALAASDAFVAADDADLTSANHSNFPAADFSLTCDFGAGVAAGSYVALYRQDLNIDGTSDAPAPATTYKHTLAGVFHIPSGASASATYPCVNVPITLDCQFSIENKSNQNLSAGWILKATPKTVEPAA